ncbi:N-terminal Xaa-Pro-Lys N-methyltransferase 1-B [Condylostylus longicornis]|uniref:N-terminal Xaa-Pro-Lys N-methyltransferase 1-B n=1 Tax=Condylostylus longicornis TaxID=2530218 RepID=UPI00244DE875|nr:N-terminal Xaa-Pro-Lys N-methyltransferase 1-B [Condylostylus longicornis]
MAVSENGDFNENIEEGKREMHSNEIVSVDQCESNVTEEELFYKKPQQYWSKIPATVDGMLGGFADIHNLDIIGSQKFLKELFLNTSSKTQVALDCGAGIGRVSKYLLIPFFEQVDLVEQDLNFCEKAPEYIGDSSGKLGKVHNCGLQNFLPEPAKYDVVWSQWVLGHLSDDDLLLFLQRIRVGLKKGGMVVIKENVTSSNKLEIDTEDSSVTRPLKTYNKILKATKYKIIKAVKQTNFPKGLYPVYMIAAVPI